MTWWQHRAWACNQMKLALQQGLCVHRQVLAEFEEMVTLVSPSELSGIIQFLKGGEGDVADHAAEIPLEDDVEHVGDGTDQGATQPPHGNLYWEVPGGTIVHNVAANSLDAYCPNPFHRSAEGMPCRLNIICTAAHKANTAQGRPLGLLMAWLADGVDHSCRRDHLKAAKDRLHYSYAKRCDGRVWRVDHFGAAAGHLFYERPARPDEGAEPHGMA